MDFRSSLGNSYVQQSQGQMPPRTEEMSTTVLLVSGYGCERMHSINFMILFIFADNGSTYY
jgi:hypothetical protein